MKALKYTFYSLLFLIIVLLIFTGVFAFKMKSSVYLTLAAKDNLEQGINSFTQKDFVSAKSQISQARDKLSQAEKEMNSVKDSFFSYPFNLYGELDQLEELLKIADSLAFNFYKLSDLSEKVNESLPQSLAGQDEALLELMKHIPEIKGLKANLSLAIYKLENIELAGWLYPVAGTFNSFRGSLLESWHSLEAVFPLLELSPYILGYPSASNFLIIFQNSHELRPTGGFIGSYGVVSSKAGQVKVVETGDSYHLDMPVKDSLESQPPTALAKYLKVDKWFLRDANWSPSWKYSAINILDIHKKIIQAWPEGREKPFAKEFDGVLAVTPDLVEDILKITGPIEVSGETFTAENFHTQLQYAVEISYRDQGISSWDRKDIIGELIKALETKIEKFQPAQFLRLFYVLDSNLAKKNILFYFKNDYAQSLVSDLNWSGEIKEVESDYLMIVDANLAALKTDSVISRQASYSLKEKTDNELSVDLKLNYGHQGQSADWRTSRYQSYTRIYLPKNAYDIQATGFSASPEIYDDNLLNKKVVAGYLTVDISKEKEVDISYKLKKDEILKNDYSFYWQKQPGTNWQVNLSVDLLDDRKVKEISPSLSSQALFSSNSFYWNLLLDTDKIFQIKY